MVSKIKTKLSADERSSKNYRESGAYRSISKDATAGLAHRDVTQAAHLQAGKAEDPDTRCLFGIG